MSVAIGGGKGGTGKSLIAVQMGILMAELGLRVVLVDADLDGANLHTFFGLEDPESSLGQVLSEETSVVDAILPTGIGRLGLVAGLYQDLRDLPGVERAEVLARRLHALDAELTIWDVGSGSSPWQTRLFELADVGVLVSSPIFQSMERDYFFLRRVCAWRMHGMMPAPPPTRGWLPVPWLAAIKREDRQLARALRKELRSRPILFLVNGVQHHPEGHLDHEIASVVSRFFDLRTTPLGCLEFDERLPLATLARRPLVSEYPDSRWVQQMRGVVDHLLTILTVDEEHISASDDSSHPDEGSLQER